MHQYVSHNLAWDKSVEAASAETKHVKKKKRRLEWLGDFSDRWVQQLKAFHYIWACCLYGDWLKPRCRATTRFPCCAFTLKSVKTDIAASARLSLKSAAFVETERLLCWHLRCSSTEGSDSCRKTDIYAATFSGFFCFFSRAKNDAQRLLSTERIAAVQWDDASDK